MCIRDRFNCPECAMPKKCGTAYLLSFPLRYRRRVYGTLALASERKVESEEMHLLSDIARTVSIALRQIEVTEEREMALKQIRRNLEQFELLADKLRNPLAVIKGYLEIRDRLDDSKGIFREIELQTKRIESALDELASEEIKTYLLDKFLRARKGERAGRSKQTKKWG